MVGLEGPMNVPGHGHSVSVTISLRPPPDILRFSMREKSGATADEARLPVGDMIVVEAVLSVPIMLWRRGFETLWLPVVDSIPSTLSPCEAFMFSMSQWQGKSPNRHNID